MAFILIIDRDGAGTKRGADALIEAGHACGWVGNAERALALLRWRLPDLILLDEDMPGPGGASLLHELRSSVEYRDMPIILLTNSPETGGQPACGAHDNIRKPFDPRFLVWRVNHAIEVRELEPQREQLRQWLARQHDAQERRSLA